MSSARCRPLAEAVASPAYLVANHTTSTESLASMARIRNVFEIIELYGHDEHFEPQPSAEFMPTRAPAGSKQKLDILADRIQRGMPLWHPEDSTEFAGVALLTGED